MAPPSAPLDSHRIEEVVAALCDRIGGEWLLVGGGLVALWLEPRRVTEDVDLVSLGEDPADRLALMQLASDLGLPIEAVNSAADFFVKRIPGWRSEVEPFRSGARGAVHRPTPTLLVLMKMGRLSAADLEDCLSVIARARMDGLRLDVARIAAALTALPETGDAALQERRRTLRERLGG